MNDKGLQLARMVSGLMKQLCPTLPIETTPATISPKIMELSANIAPGQMPVFVPVEVEQTAQYGECFRNVKAIVADKGGAMQTGWIVWEAAGLLLEFERHAVWESGGRLIDITPKPDWEDKICFLPDTEPWDGKKTANKKFPLGNQRRFDHAKPMTHKTRLKQRQQRRRDRK